MPAALQHAYPQWGPPEDEPHADVEDYREVWRGKARIVRNPKRARLLRKRGVPLMDTGFRTARRGRFVWFWFVEDAK
jgi:hypothetical protein